MRQEKVFRLGKILIDGEIIRFEPEPTAAFEATRSDIVSVGVAYQYVEATEDKEHTRIRLTASLEGAREESHEAHIGDNPALDDSRKGFLSVPIRVKAAGELRGRFVIESEYEARAWSRKEPSTSASERVEGAFTIHVK